MTSITIRPARADDAHGIATVHVKTWHTAYTGLMPQDLLDSLDIDQRAKHWQEIIQAMKPTKINVVAEHDNQIIGWCTAGTSRDEDAPANSGEVYGIYVLAEHQGSGVGSRLIEAAEKWLVQHKFSRSTLWVLDTNAKSIKWYTSKGYLPDGGTKIEQHNNFQLSEIRMAKSLQG